MPPDVGEPVLLWINDLQRSIGGDGTRHFVDATPVRWCFPSGTAAACPHAEFIYDDPQAVSAASFAVK